jgi:hypothetical protein
LELEGSTLPMQFLTASLDAKLDVLLVRPHNHYKVFALGLAASNCGVLAFHAGRCSTLEEVPTCYLLGARLLGVWLRWVDYVVAPSKSGLEICLGSCLGHRVSISLCVNSTYRLGCS